MSAQWRRLDNQLVFITLLLHVLRLGGWIGRHDLRQKLPLVVYGSSFNTLNTIANRELRRAPFLRSRLLGLQVGQVDRRQRQTVRSVVLPEGSNRIIVFFLSRLFDSFLIFY